MNILLNPTSNFIDVICNQPDYIPKVFLKTLKCYQFSENGSLGLLQAIVPSLENLGITKRQRAYAINRLAEIGLWTVVTDNNRKGSIVQFRNDTGFLDFTFVLQNSSASSSNMAEINGVKFIAPEWLDLEGLQDELAMWFDHLRNRGVNISQKTLPKDLDKLNNLFNYFVAEYQKPKTIHNIFYASQTVLTLQKAIISDCIENGYTSFQHSFSRKETILFEKENTLAESPKNTKSTRDELSEKWTAIFLTLKDKHGCYPKRLPYSQKFTELAGKEIDFSKLEKILQNSSKNSNFELPDKLFSVYDKKPKQAQIQPLLTKKEIAENEKIERERIAKTAENAIKVIGEIEWMK
jgi:hypothetical protein